MIHEAKAIKLIRIYFYICEQWEIDLKHLCKRFSNNNQPELSDQEIMDQAEMLGRKRYKLFLC